MLENRWLPYAFGMSRRPLIGYEDFLHLERDNLKKYSSVATNHRIALQPRKLEFRIFSTFKIPDSSKNSYEEHVGKKIVSDLGRVRSPMTIYDPHRNAPQSDSADTDTWQICFSRVKSRCTAVKVVR